MKSSYDSDKLKQYELNVLDNFVSICKKNNIKYFLAYGTLLGAVRHKGFIPWDDDIDVYMKPEDYYRFKEVMLNNSDTDYFYQSLETEKYYSLTFAKLRKNNTSVIEERVKDEDIHTGIYIDIFPLLPFPNDKKAQTKFFYRLKVMNLLIEADLKNKVKYNNYGKVGKILSIICRFIPRKIRNKIASYQLKKCLLTSEVYDKYFCIFDQKTFDKNLFDKEAKVEFEGKKYSSPKDYDKYLTSMYGDYMTPPPVDKRGGHSFISVDFEKNTDKVDFVIMWVDGSDKNWLEEKNKYASKKIDVTNAVNRYRDMGILKYWFRGVEKFTPWVNKIHFVTWGHIPEWLDTNNPKINIVKHEDFIPKEYLPVFNSCAIEVHLHRIKGLSEKFVYFNDDMFLLKSISQDYFFAKNGLPKDMWRDNIPYCDENTDKVFEHHLLNVKMLICRHFNKREVMNKYFSKCINPKYGKRNIRFLMLYKWPYMAGFDNFHVASPFLKKTFEEVWDKEREVLEITASDKFRTVNDINQYVFQLWQIYSGNFVPKSYKQAGKFFNLSNNNEELFNCIDNQENEQICINDSDLNVDYERVTKELQEHFEKILPIKSNFEK